METNFGSMKQLTIIINEYNVYSNKSTSSAYKCLTRSIHLFPLVNISVCYTGKHCRVIVCLVNEHRILCQYSTFGEFRSIDSFNNRLDTYVVNVVDIRCSLVFKYLYNRVHCRHSIVYKSNFVIK
jgi:hypothetical protein